MTYPGPTFRRRGVKMPEAEMMELEARRGIHAGMLPSNLARAEIVDGVTGGRVSPESQMRGWTAQQPFTHVDCPVLHFCILCAKTVEPDFLRDHRCKVAAELEH